MVCLDLRTSEHVQDKQIHLTAFPAAATYWFLCIIQSRILTFDICFWQLQLLYNICIYALICCVMFVSTQQYLF